MNQRLKLCFERAARFFLVLGLFLLLSFKWSNYERRLSKVIGKDAILDKEEVAANWRQYSPPAQIPLAIDTPPTREFPAPLGVITLDNGEEMRREVDNIHAYLQKNVQYPREAARRNIQGTVIIQFVLKADGTIGEVEVVYGGELGNGVLAEEVIRVLKGTGGWKTAKVNGQPVDVTVTMPITFKLK
jgi:protein TonB